MTKLFLIGASAVMSITSAPVLARDPAPSPTTTTTAPAEQPATPRAAKSTQRYCVIDTITGSRIPVRKCQTRDGWLAEGFDPLNPDK